MAFKSTTIHNPPPCRGCVSALWIRSCVVGSNSSNGTSYWLMPDALFCHHMGLHDGKNQVAKAAHNPCDRELMLLWVEMSDHHPNDVSVTTMFEEHLILDFASTLPDTHHILWLGGISSRPSGERQKCNAQPFSPMSSSCSKYDEKHISIPQDHTIRRTRSFCVRRWCVFGGEV